MTDAPYCLHPFLQLHISNNGQARACCVANIPFGNINDQSLEEIWQGEAIEAIREKFTRGETDNRCAVCHRLEEAGAESIRQETFRKFDYRKIDRKPALPVYFDIRFSNVCNYRCRTCWHGASSKWFNDAKVLGTHIGQSAIIKNITDFEDFVSKCEAALLQAEEFYFAGGEPLVTEEHYRLLEWLIERGATKARLRYNTNFSKLEFKQYHALDLWKHFPEVEILASIDATENLGEYIRKEMDWSRILNNRERIRALPHLSFKIAPTISVLNVHHLPELYRQSISLNLIEPEDLYINILERPAYYNIQVLEENKKATIANKLLKMMSDDLPPSINKSIQEVLDYMLAKDRSHLWPQFLEATKQLDDLRSEQGEEVLEWILS